jgi:hypothetical protein
VDPRLAQVTRGFEDINGGLTQAINFPDNQFVAGFEGG